MLEEQLTEEELDTLWNGGMVKRNITVYVKDFSGIVGSIGTC